MFENPNWLIPEASRETFLIILYAGFLLSFQLITLAQLGEDSIFLEQNLDPEGNNTIK